MKQVVSVSLGSSKRNHSVETEILGTPIRIERIGTDGDFNKAISLLKQLDGRVDAIGLGGIDIYLQFEDRKFYIRDAKKLVKAVKKTPVVDGGGLKHVIESIAVHKIHEMGFSLSDKKVLLVSGVDRWGMAKAFLDLGADITFGDLIFGLNLPIPVKGYDTFKKLAFTIAPVVTKMPFKILYPTGKEQEKEPDPKFARYYEDADVIAGDFHFVRKFMPENMNGKWIITNTTTSSDVAEMKERGIKYLFTTTPVYNGRSFGTNVMEAAFVAILEKKPDEISNQDYIGLLEKMNYEPHVEELN